MIRPQRHALAGRLVFWSLLLGFLLLGTAAQAHDHSHRHAAPARAEAMPSPPDDATASGQHTPADDEHGHQHSGDALKDLLTLGHNHVGGTCPGLPPTLWILVDAPHVSQPVVPWPERTLGDSRPDTPFRPPIA
jgi:hypothetical protein